METYFILLSLRALCDLRGKYAEQCLTDQPERARVRCKPWDSPQRLIVLNIMKRDQQEEETFGRVFRRGGETRAEHANSRLVTCANLWNTLSLVVPASLVQLARVHLYELKTRLA